tara:strand:- start:709 stop:984 length:276 start_codon:yes stop_codon:yes gene_type:complete
MANKPKTKTRKNRVKVPNVGPGKSVSVEESKPITTSEPIKSNTESTNILKSKSKTTKIQNQNTLPYKREIIRISITSMITFGILIALIFTM